MIESRLRCLWFRTQAGLAQANAYIQRQANMPVQPIPAVVSDFEDLSSSNPALTKRK